MALTPVLAVLAPVLRHEGAAAVPYLVEGTQAHAVPHLVGERHPPVTQADRGRHDRRPLGGGERAADEVTHPLLVIDLRVPPQRIAVRRARGNTGMASKDCTPRSRHTRGVMSPQYKAPRASAS